VQRRRSGTGRLASIGAAGPFVGLFETIFGIMNRFLAMAATKTTNLAVMAPGIADALLATVGLVATIPAVLLYNAIPCRIGAIRHGFANGRVRLLLRLSRELDKWMGT
jgi:biopolymer transport protein ExbB